MTLDPQALNQSFRPSGDQKQQSALTQKKSEEIRGEGCGFGPHNRAAKQEAVHGNQRQQPCCGKHRQCNQALRGKTQGHQGFRPGCDGIRQGNELRQHTAE